jgi:hypothetical protein
MNSNANQNEKSGNKTGSQKTDLNVEKVSFLDILKLDKNELESTIFQLSSEK